MDFHEIGKEGTVKEGIFNRFPELVPTFPANFKDKKKKHKSLLLIAESNYFNDNDIGNSDFLDADKWYLYPDAKLIPESRKKDVSTDISYKTFDKVFGIMCKVLEENHIGHGSRLLDETGFYNYFLRPAYSNGKSKGFNPQTIDKQVAGEALEGILRIAEPELVIFLSKLAFKEFDIYCRAKQLDFGNMIFEHVSHPASFWWNKREGIYGKLKFENLLKQYWIREQQVQPCFSEQQEAFNSWAVALSDKGYDILGNWDNWDNAGEWKNLGVISQIENVPVRLAIEYYTKRKQVYYGIAKVDDEDKVSQELMNSETFQNIITENGLTVKNNEWWYCQRFSSLDCVFEEFCKLLASVERLWVHDIALLGG